MRPWALLVLAVVLLAPAAAAQQPVTVAAGTYHAVPTTVAAGDTYRVDVSADHAIDVLLVQGTDDAFVTANWTGTVLAQRLNATSGSFNGTFPADGRWTLIVDNTQQPAGGANGSANATVTLAFEVVHRLPPTAPPQAVDEAGSQNPWPVLMLTSPFWDLAIVGLGGMALWFLLLGALLGAGYREGWEKVGVLAAGSAVLIGAWSLIPGRGAALQTTIPLLVAAGIAWVAYRGTTDGRQGFRLGFLAAGLGALLGVALGHLLSLLWSDPGLMLLGAERFDDPVFMMPLAAGGGALVLALIAALVEASEPEEEPAPTPSQGITTSFTVDCLRCGTPIKVDRSMKRYRVATDRYEFACPNCHAWMEWAEPKPDGAAAA